MVASAPGNLDWNLVRTFVAVADTGSLAAGARSLGLAHPTAARHIQQLETALGLSLFDRRPTGLILNEAGDRLAASARSMLLSARAFEQASLRISARTSGPVRITASEFLADVFPQMLAPLRRAHEDDLINIDLLIANHQLNLLQRDADIAIRHARPDQQDLVCRRISGLPFGLYASESYLAERGEPALGNLNEHWFIDAVSEPRFARQAARLGYPIDRRQFVFRSDSLTGQIHAAAAGWGIAGLPIHIAREQPGLRPVLRDAPIQELEMWLVARDEVRATAYLKKTFDTVGELMNAFVAKVGGSTVSA